jgi:transcription elongation GreA/GreB family factor
MNVFEENPPATEITDSSNTGYAALRELSIACLLTRADRREIEEHIRRADKIGTGVHVVLARLLSKKLFYASEVQDDTPCPSTATGGSRVTYAIDDLPPHSGRLVHRNENAYGQSSIHVATLLGATLIGMTAGAQAPFLQASGSFRKVRLLSVDYQAQARSHATQE